MEPGAECGSKAKTGRFRCESGENSLSDILCETWITASSQRYMVDEAAVSLDKGGESSLIVCDHEPTKSSGIIIFIHYSSYTAIGLGLADNKKS